MSLSDILIIRLTSLAAEFIARHGVRPTAVLVRPDAPQPVTTAYRVIVTDSITEEMKMALI